MIIIISIGTALKANECKQISNAAGQYLCKNFFDIKVVKPITDTLVDFRIWPSFKSL